MAVRPVLGSALSCGRCRNNLIRTFIAASGIELPLVQQRPGWQRARNFQQIAPFSQTSRRLQGEELRDDLADTPGDLGLKNDNVESQDTQEQALQSSSEPAPTTPYVPWYLQVDQPAAQQETHTSERQRIPDLPDSPPPILQPILEQVSVDLGMDDLSLLDLRTLDPPPALGSNVIMIIGTARSEKHLHVSADRLCRWLRSNYNLSPFADGLLGRNELKLKMRRKAKKTRMLSAVGAKETGGAELDDGLRTGWVCVNVGRVEGGELETEQKPDIKGFVGFGSVSSGSRIVVQLMTDEKRGQIDLEALWNGILRRSKKALEEEQREGEVATESLDEEHGADGASPQGTKTAFSGYSRSGLVGDTRFSSRSPQARLFHTSARRLNPATPQAGRLQETVETLRSMVEHVKAMEPNVAIEALGMDSEDQDSTPFLRSFYEQLPTWPEHDHWQAILSLRSHAVQLGHPGYLSDCLIGTLDDMEAACIEPTEEDCLSVLSVLLEPAVFTRTVRTSQANTSSDPSTRARKPLDNAIHHALSIWTRMEDAGHTLPQSFYLRRLQRTIQHVSPTSPKSVPSFTSAAPIFTSTPQANRSPVPILSALNLSAATTALSKDAFDPAWDIWASWPRRFLPRDEKQYIAFLNAMADTGHQKEIGRALRRTVPTMVREEPGVDLRGEVAAAVARCLEIVEPDVGREGWMSGGVKGEWAALWARAQRGLRAREQGKKEGGGGKEEEHVGFGLT